MANVVLKAQDLINTSTKIKDAATRIENDLRKLDSVMGDMQSVWDDKNAKTYLERYEELKQEFPEFKNAVNSYGTFLDTVVDVYQREFSDEISNSVNANQ